MSELKATLLVKAKEAKKNRVKFACRVVVVVVRGGGGRVSGDHDGDDGEMIALMIADIY